MKKWFVSAKRADFTEIGKKFNITPMTARIIRNRDVIGDEQIRKFLHGAYGKSCGLQKEFIMKTLMLCRSYI